MQATLANLPVHSPVRSLTQLAKQIALPHEFSPLRFPSFPALERTALMGFNAPFPLAVTSAEDYEKGKVMVARQAAYPFWAVQPTILETYSVGWLLYGHGAVNTVTTYSAPLVGAPASYTTGSCPASLTQPGFSGVGVLGPRANYAIVGVDSRCDSTPFVYVPPGGKLALTGAGTTAFSATHPVNVLVQVAMWTSPGEETQHVFGFTIAAANLGGSLLVDVDTAWIRPVSISFESASGNTFDIPATVCVNFGALCGATAVYTPSTTTMGNYAMTGSSKDLFMPIISPPEFANSMLPWYATRTTATAALFTNTTQVLNKAGVVLAGRISPNVISPWKVDHSYISSLHPAEKSFLGLETGLYTFVPPSTDLASFWDYTAPSFQGGPSGSNLQVGNLPPVYRLDNDAMVNFAFFSSPVQAMLAVNLDWHVEFRTSSALFQIGISTMTLETLHLAQLSLHEAGFFFENPEHEPVLKRITSKVAKYAGYLTPVVDIASPAAGKLLRKAVSAAKSYTAPQKQQTKVKATTLAAATKEQKPKEKQKKHKKNRT